MSEYVPQTNPLQVAEKLLGLCTKAQLRERLREREIAYVMLDMIASRGGSRWLQGESVSFTGRWGLKFDLRYNPKLTQPEGGGFDSVSLEIDPGNLGIARMTNMVQFDGIDLRLDQGADPITTKIDPNSGAELPFRMDTHRKGLLASELSYAFSRTIFPNE